MAKRTPFKAKFIDTTEEDEGRVFVFMYGLPFGTPGYDLVCRVEEKPGVTTHFAGRSPPP